MCVFVEKYVYFCRVLVVAFPWGSPSPGVTVSDGGGGGGFGLRTGFLLEKLHQWEVCLIHPRPATYVCSDRWVLLVRCTQGLALVEVDMHQFFEIARPSDEYR